MKLINLGCGSVYSNSKDWINIDLTRRPGVIQFDITKDLPFESESVDFCYSSHVLEHLKTKAAKKFICEQFRILKRGSTIRVVVPDLEVICRNYLKYLDEVLSGNKDSTFRYDYSYLELYDQVARYLSGGELGFLWREGDIKDIEFVKSRHGLEFEEAILNIKSQQKNRKMITFTAIIKRIRKIKNVLINFFTESVIFLLNGKKNVNSYREGIFRNSGEIHYRMYDQFSLKNLLEEIGFIDIKVMSAGESNFSSFDDYQLENMNNKIRKPDSLFMEGIKP